MTQSPDYTRIKREIFEHLPESDRPGAQRIAEQLARQYMHTGMPITRETLKRESQNEKVLHEQIKQGLEGKNLTVMFGGGKDSEMVVAIARYAQLEILERYGKTFTLRVFEGLQPGMIDVGANIDRCYDKLGLVGDPLTRLYSIANHEVIPYIGEKPLPEKVTGLHRASVLINSHIFSGAGRRTFCDDCNITLAGWIAAALAHDGGADVYMTGDGPKEIKGQMGTAVPEMAKQFKVSLPKGGELSPTQDAFLRLKMVADAKMNLVYDDPKDVEARTIPVGGIPDRTRLLTVFPKIPYESAGRLNFYTDYLGFSFDSLMFSFTESDCGNPALMCHLYGLIAEHVHADEGATYADGVRSYVEYGLGKMDEKGFPKDLIEQMRDRYKDDAHIAQMREKVEEYAQRAYDLKPEHMIAMVYAPFTQQGTNLDRYLDHLANHHYENGRTIRKSKDQIRQLLAQPDYIPTKSPLIKALSESTGLNFQQMRSLYKKGLAINNFDPEHQTDDITKHLLDVLKKDVMYIGQGAVTTATGQTYTQEYQGR